MKPKWQRLEKPHLYTYIKEDDVCIYARDYTGGRKGYEAGETNSLILNFKKPPSKKNTDEWKWRENAINRFAIEISHLFKPDFKWTITAVPSSKTKDDPEYNNRFEDLFKQLLKLRPTLRVEWSVEIKQTVDASHHSGEREPEIIKENYIWKGFKKGAPKSLCIMDDILTSGAHFRAMSDFLRENKYDGKIVGVFLAKTVLN